MLQTVLKPEAVKKLRHGHPWLRREDIARIEGEADEGGFARLLDENGRSLGLADVDLESNFAVRRLGLPDEAPEGIIHRHLRRAFERRSAWVDDPRYCRVVNDDGDGLPGLIIDRYDQHYVMRTFTRPMDARAQEVARALVDVSNASSVLLRNDSHKRVLLGLPSERPKVIYGTPPRWTRLLELGARFTVDLYSGAGTGYFYDQREVRKLISSIARGARVLDASCGVGGLFVHAGLHGARSVLAFERNPDVAELARENAEANGLFGRAAVENGDPFELLKGVNHAHDLVLFDAPTFVDEEDPLGAFVELARLCVRATAHGGRMVIVGYTPPLPEGELDELIAQACEAEERVAFRLHRPGLPTDFPTVLGSPGAEYLSALVIEVS